MASGTAFKTSTTSGSGTFIGVSGSVSSHSLGSSSGNSSSSSSSSSKSSSSSSSSSENDYSDYLDWIEVLLDRIERQIDNLNTIASSTYKTYTKRNSAISDEIALVQQEIEDQQKGYDRYIQEANSVNLSSSYKKKVQNGTIDIQEITDEDLADRISLYTEWYEKALDCRDAVYQLSQDLASLYEDAFNNVQSEYENMLGVIDHQITMLQNYVNLTSTEGYKVSTQYYTALINAEQSSIKKLQEEHDALTKSLNDAVASGTIEKYSEAWLTFKPHHPVMSGIINLSNCWNALKVA